MNHEFCLYSEDIVIVLLGDSSLEDSAPNVFFARKNLYTMAERFTSACAL